MFATTGSYRVQLEQFHLISIGFVDVTYEMLTHKGECLQQIEQILQKVFLFIHTCTE